MIGENMIRDLRYGVRSIGKSPGFTAVALLTLALGIGGNAIIFSAVNGILVEHWPYADADRLLVIAREQIAWGVTPDEAQAIEELATAFEQIAIADGGGVTVTGPDGFPMNRSRAEVSGNFFSMLGVEPELGRYIGPADTQTGGPPVVVLSNQFWLEAFGGDRNIVGRELRVDDARYSVIGVMPKTFELGVSRGARDAGVWLPLVDPAPDRRMTQLVGKVRPGVPLSTAQQQITALSPRLIDRFPAGAANIDLVADQPRLNIFSNVRNGLLILQAAVAFVLLLACINVSALLVARAWSRQRELTIRKTLGASRLRIIGQLLAESLVLAIASGVLACLFAFGGIRVLHMIAPPDTPRLDRVQLDGQVLLFTLAVSVLAAFLFGLLPALQAASRKGDFIRGGLSAITVRSASRQRQYLRNGLIVFEVALAAVLVVGGGLMVRSFDKLMSVDPGVEADRALVVLAQLGRTSCIPSCLQIAPDILQAANALPGVEQAAISATGPIGGGIVWPEIRIDGRSGAQPFDGVENIVSPGFFRAAGMRLLRGRPFADADDRNVAVVNEAFASRYLNGDALGQRFYASTADTGNEADESAWKEVIGVVNDTRNRAIQQFGSGATFYTPSTANGSFFTLTVRTSSDPSTMIAPIRQIIRAADSSAVIGSAQTLEQALLATAALPRFYTTLFGTFGMLALLLGIIGVYGVTAYSVVERTHEVGVRMALGAPSERVIRDFIAEKAALAVAGIVIGLAGAVALGRSVEHMLFEIQPLDPLTFGGVAILLLVATLVACYLPASAATRISPVNALRHE